VHVFIGSLLLGVRCSNYLWSVYRSSNVCFVVSSAEERQLCFCVCPSVLSNLTHNLHSHSDDILWLGGERVAQEPNTR